MFSLTDILENNLVTNALQRNSLSIYVCILIAIAAELISQTLSTIHAFISCNLIKADCPIKSISLLRFLVVYEMEMKIIATFAFIYSIYFSFQSSFIFIISDEYLLRTYDRRKMRLKTPFIYIPIIY